MICCREVLLFDLHSGLRFSLSSWDLGVQIYGLLQGRGCSNDCPVFNHFVVSCRVLSCGLSESSAYLAPCIYEVRFFTCPEFLSLWVALSRFSSDKLFFHPAEPEDFDHLSRKAGWPKVPDKCHCRFGINLHQMCSKPSLSWMCWIPHRLNLTHSGIAGLSRCTAWQVLRYFKVYRQK